MSPIRRRGNLQDLAERLDPIGITMLVDEGSQDFSRRSSSAWAKNALASLSISLARRNSLTSRSSSFMRCASVVVTPSRMPASTSARLTHSFKVCGTQPIFGAMDSMAAHRDGYSPRCSCTIRTAHSRTSGENLFDFVMAQSSQSVEPPQNPERFSPVSDTTHSPHLAPTVTPTFNWGGGRRTSEGLGGHAAVHRPHANIPVIEDSQRNVAPSGQPCHF